VKAVLYFLGGTGGLAVLHYLGLGKSVSNATNKNLRMRRDFLSVVCDRAFNILGGSEGLLATYVRDINRPNGSELRRRKV
jgi:hypothetical protein